MDESKEIIEKQTTDRYIKFVAVKASPSVVCVVTHDIPDDMLLVPRRRIKKKGERDWEYVFSGSGVIIECSSSSSSSGDGGTRYVSTIITAAILFERSNGVQPKDIQVDVYLHGGKLYKGELLGCDFHYNLAAIRIESDSPLQTATIRGSCDVSSTYLADQPPPCGNGNKPFQLHPHSTLYNIQHGTRLITICRPCVPPFSIHVHSCVLGPEDTYGRSSEDICNELLPVADCNYKENGAPVFNCYSEFIGMMFNGLLSYNFLPSNFVSRWWNHFKCFGEFRRPWLGLEVSDLHEASVDFLDELARSFSNTDKGVVVTQVDGDSSELQPDDVIVKFDGKPVRSRLEFLERIWDNAGKSVKLSFQRASNGDQGIASMTIGEAIPGNFKWWSCPRWIELKTT